MTAATVSLVRRRKAHQAVACVPKRSKRKSRLDREYQWGGRKMFSSRLRTLISQERVTVSATAAFFHSDENAKGLRTAEISNWTGKALAAPRTELDRLVARDECEKAGVYVLTGSDPTQKI